MKNGYLGELDLHKSSLENALAAVPDEAEREETAGEDLQEILDTLLQSIGNYSTAASAIQKVIVSGLNKISVELVSRTIPEVTYYSKY